MSHPFLPYNSETPNVRAKCPVDKRCVLSLAIQWALNQVSSPNRSALKRVCASSLLFALLWYYYRRGRRHLLRRCIVVVVVVAIIIVIIMRSRYIMHSCVRDILFPADVLSGGGRMVVHCRVEFIPTNVLPTSMLRSSAGSGINQHDISFDFYRHHAISCTVFTILDFKPFFYSA